MIGPLLDTTDDRHFGQWAGALLRGLGETYRPARLIAVKIDNYFGPRWCRFAGKVLGIAGARTGPAGRPVVPPFVPSRVVDAFAYEQDGGLFRPCPWPPPRVHVWQNSEDNFRRFFAEEFARAAILWFSGQTTRNGMGSAMAYVHDEAEGEVWTWHAELERRGSAWRLARTKHIDRDELEYLTGVAPALD